MSRSLFEKWATLNRANIFNVDISIECTGLTRTPELPDKIEGESEGDYNVRCNNAISQYYEAIDEVARKRQEQFETIVTAYNENQGFEYIDYVDSFSVRITINGNGLRDLVHNFGYIFEVTESVEIEMELAKANTSQINDTRQCRKS